MSAKVAADKIPIEDLLVRPNLNPRQARRVLSCSRDFLNDLVENKKVEWFFVNGEESKRRHIRIVTKSLLEWQDKEAAKAKGAA